MRRPVLATAAATALLALALPSSATEDAEPTEPVPTAPCEAVEGATTVDGTQEAQTVAAPLLPNAPFNDASSVGGIPTEKPAESILDLAFVVDASGGDGTANQPVDATRAQVDFTVAWEGDAGDFDIYVLDDQGRELGSGTSFNPLDGPGEIASAGTRDHCSLVTLRIENYAGVPATELTVTALRGRLR